MNKKNTKVDIMLYRKNILSFLFCIIAIICDVAMFLTIYRNNACIPNFQLGIDLIINVVYLLVCFLIAEKMEAYNVKSGYTAFVVAGVQVLRIFWIPLEYKINGGLSAGQFIACIVLFVVSAAALVFAGLVTIYKARQLSEHLKSLKKESR